MPFVRFRGKNYLYLHVPKTGGGTIEHWMRSQGKVSLLTAHVPGFLRVTPQHLRMSDVKSLLGDGFFDHVFMTVRNPYDRAVSEYRMRTALKDDSFWKDVPTFSQWLEDALDRAAKDPLTHDNHMRPQWHFTDSGVEVLPFEMGMGDVLARMAEVMGAEPPSDVPHLHEVKGVRPEVDLTHIDRLRIEDFYRGDFDTFGYGRIAGTDVVSSRTFRAAELAPSGSLVT